MFEITDSEGEVWINYNGGEGRQWILAMMQEEERQLLAILLERAGGLQNLAIAQRCAFLTRQIEGAQHQHDDRASGAFGPERNTPEQIGFWRGVKSGLEQARDELDLLNLWTLDEVDQLRTYYADQLKQLEEFEPQRQFRTPYSNGVSDMAQKTIRDLLERLDAICNTI